MNQAQAQPKVIIVGAGWAGLGAAYHLAKQGYDITLLEAGGQPGGLVAGWKTAQGRSVEAVTARELFKQFGVSARLYKESFEPMLLVGLFAPGEQCSAAAALGMLYYFILAHQPDFDVLWCRGTVGERIFRPWGRCCMIENRDRSRL